MIELQGIVKRYVLGGETVLALAGVDLSIGRNEYVALIGPSGSGKSTLINILGCLDSPTEGRYLLNGRVLRHAMVKIADNPSIPAIPPKPAGEAASDSPNEPARSDSSN